jgi:hypothetical protein
MMVVDPPEGWRYGFPKPVPEGYMKMSWEDKKDWYVEQGYPAEKIEELGNFFYVSMWYRGDEQHGY